MSSVLTSIEEKYILRRVKAENADPHTVTFQLALIELTIILATTWLLCDIHFGLGVAMMVPVYLYLKPFDTEEGLYQKGLLKRAGEGNEEAKNNKNKKKRN